VGYIRELVEAGGADALRDYLPKLPAHLRRDVERVSGLLLLRFAGVLHEAKEAYRDIPAPAGDRGTFARAVMALGRRDSAILFHLWEIDHGIAQTKRVDPETKLRALCWKLVDHRDVVLMEGSKQGEIEG
jgi:hypothetical protein